MKETKYLIVGNGTAAAGGITGIRKADPDGSITVISGEDRHVYSRPLISYWLEGRVKTENMHYRGDDFYQANGVEVYFGVRAEAVDPESRVVTLSDGTAIRYEKLLAATGSHPFVPPIEGKDKAADAFTFTTMDDAEGIRAVLTPASRVVILGAGLIGLKAAEALLGQCESIIVADLAERVLPSVLDADSSAIYADYLRKLGLDLRLGTSITRIGDHSVTLSDDSTLPYDILILAVGTRPAGELLQAAGAEIGRGIVTDVKQATSLPDVYAAGDCTQSHDIASGTDKNLAILPNAYMQGETAGINMAGGEAVYDQAFPVNSMGFKDYYMLTAGSYDGEAVTLREGNQFRRFYVKDDCLKGYIILGDCQRAAFTPA